MVPNQKGIGDSSSSHCMAITTRSVKLLQNDHDKEVEEGPSKKEEGAHIEVSIVVEEAQVEVPNVVEVDIVPEKVHVQKGKAVVDKVVSERRLEELPEDNQIQFVTALSMEEYVARQKGIKSISQSITIRERELPSPLESPYTLVDLLP
ncbi:hypothetical protein RND71_010579 [Anisodus tanguticus]|uniref:Uncharacterized protein n=1 Tax=Anisodus tanguticus TaxID=243964 RepID=A0AAE1SK26_9SOLA|nr:hypothetical protein RND71_010579 [Anisodus tanguticus]